VMRLLQALKSKLVPSGLLERLMRRFADACRLVSASPKGRDEHGEERVGYAGLSKPLTGRRDSAETAWLADAPVHPLRPRFWDPERTHSSFARFPKFEKRGRHGSFRHPDPKGIELDQADSRIFLHKLGRLLRRDSRKALGDLLGAIFSLSRRVWGSDRRRKAVQDAARILEHNQLRDFWHRASTAIGKGRAMARIEGLQTRDASESAGDRPTQAGFERVECGFEGNADAVGAIDILPRPIQPLRDEGRDTTDASVGMRADRLPASARMACGSNRVGGRKQEPTNPPRRALSKGPSGGAHRPQTKQARKGPWQPRSAAIEGLGTPDRGVGGRPP